MPLVERFLNSIRGFLKTRDGDKLRAWLRVEPPVPQDYHNLTSELRSSFRDGARLESLVDRLLPQEDDLPDDQGTAWPGFNAFMKDYLEYWRDVDFDDLLRAHQLLIALTISCTTALNHPQHGTIMLQTSMSLAASLSKLSMTLNKRPDLTKKLRSNDADEDEKSVVETTAEVIQKIFTTCLADRSPCFTKPEGKKVGVYIFANITLKLLFACKRTHLAKQLFTNITSKSPILSIYPAGQRVQYLYYLGRFHFINHHFIRASQCLQEAYLQTPPSFMNHRRLILTYLIPSNLLLGRLPSQALLQRPEAQPLGPIFAQFALAIRKGDFLVYQQALRDHERWLFRRGLLLTLNFRLRPLVWRSFSRRTFLLTYSAPTDADSRKAATLELAHLLTAATFVQKRLEGYVPSKQGHKAHQQSTNPIFLKALANSAESTLTPPPGGPKKLRPNDGLVWGNMAVTAEHVEDLVASLVAQGLLHGYLAHSQGRFAIMGAKQKGSAVAAGWPNVGEVMGLGERDVPGWVRD